MVRRLDLVYLRDTDWRFEDPRSAALRTAMVSFTMAGTTAEKLQGYLGAARIRTRRIAATNICTGAAMPPATIAEYRSRATVTMRSPRSRSQARTSSVGAAPVGVGALGAERGQDHQPDPGQAAAQAQQESARNQAERGTCASFAVGGVAASASTDNRDSSRPNPANAARMSA